MNFGSLSLLREEARRKREERNGKGGGSAGEKRSGPSRGDDEPDKKKMRTGEDRTSELLRELQDLKKKNEDELGHGKKTDPIMSSATEPSGGETAGAAAAEEEVEDEETRKKDIQVMLKLREFGQPICLFAETAKQRVTRLKAIEEQMKEKMTDAELRVLTNIDKAEELRKKREQEKESAAASAAAGLDPKDEKPTGDESSDEEEEAGAGAEGGDGKGKKPPIDKTCKEEVVRKYLKGLLKEWEAEFAAKSTKEFLESHRGKLAAVTLKQCRESVSYLFDLLRQRTVPEDVVDHLDKIVDFMKKREYVLATDEYLKIAIGNAAWPMGVTMVGIHERAGRERIFTQKVARLLLKQTYTDIDSLFYITVVFEQIFLMMKLHGSICSL